MEENSKALIIDDEKDICFLLSRLLKQKDIASRYVCTLKDAQYILETQKPEIIFLDNHLPDGLGINFIHKIKKLLPLTKIVMITAHDTTVDRDNAFKEGVDFFIGKPFSKETIINILQLHG